MTNRLLLIMLCFTLAFMSGCSTVISAVKTDSYQEEPGQRTSGNFIDDQIIETKALVNIDKADQQLAQSHVNVTSFNRVVLITGQVANEELRQKAENAVSLLGSDVKRIHNELALGGATSMVVRSNDGWISTKIKSKMLANSKIQGSRIKVVTENGVVYLLGLVTREEGDRAAEVARTTAGVQKVVRIFEYI